MCASSVCMFKRYTTLFFHSMIRLGLTILNIYITAPAPPGGGRMHILQLDRDILTLHKLHLPLIVLYKIIGGGFFFFFGEQREFMIRVFFFCWRIRLVCRKLIGKETGYLLEIG